MSNSDQEMKAYYAQRAPIYDRVYAYPERQADLRVLKQKIPGLFDNKHVLEVAAGTGYWTQVIAKQAQAITAIDATASALEKVALRDGAERVTTHVWDAYNLDDFGGQYDAAFAGLWLSHVPKHRLRAFVESVCRKVQSQGHIVFLDNTQAQCARLPISHTDEQGNTYQDRELDDGGNYRVLKNFPSESELNELIKGLGCNASYTPLEHFWMFQFQLV